MTLRNRFSSFVPIVGSTLATLAMLAACSSEAPKVAGDEHAALAAPSPNIGPAALPGGGSVCDNLCDGTACTTFKAGGQQCICDGPCPTGQTCQAGACKCPTTCDDVSCGGPDGCGGTCGCSGDAVCEHNRCVPPWIDGTTRDIGMDRPGFDFSQGASPSVEACATECIANASCVAWTYRGSDSQCWLKTGASDPVASAATVSGRVSRTYETGVNRYGDDEVEFDTSSASVCHDACEADLVCQSFSFDGSHCYLKSGYGTPVPGAGYTSGFKGLGSHALDFADGDARLTQSTPDWETGSFKAECGQSTVTGLSVDTVKRTAHAALCGDDPDSARFPHQNCHGVDFTTSDNRGDTSTGDWAYGAIKGECSADEYVAGVSQTPDGFLDGILCCQGLVTKNDCHTYRESGADHRGNARTSDWDSGFFKLECDYGSHVAGVARNNDSGAMGGVNSILCCADDETREGLPKHIDYNGGLLMTAPTTTLYYVFYGAWTKADEDVLINFAQHLGGSAYYAIATSYHDYHPWYVKNNIAFGGYWEAGYFRGSGINDSQPLPSDGSAIVDAARSVLGDDTNAIYVILPSADVSAQSKRSDLGDFPGDWCGYHELAGPYKYAIAGRDQSGGLCSWNSHLKGESYPTTPNGDALDFMVNVIAHEVFETVTDPGPGSGYGDDASKMEEGDLCQTQSAPTAGAYWNLKLGNRYYLVQRQLDVVPGLDYGTCEMSHFSTGIGVQSATYGENCPNWSDHTTMVGDLCNGSPTCDFAVHTSELRDPSPGCAKEFTVMWTCHDGPRVFTQPGEADGSIIHLSCE